MEFEAKRCPHCGTFPEDYLDEDGRQKDTPPHVPMAFRCYGCVATAEENEFAKKHDSKGGLHIRLVRNIWKKSRFRGDQEELDAE